MVVPLLRQSRRGPGVANNRALRSLSANSNRLHHKAPWQLAQSWPFGLVSLSSFCPPVGVVCRSSPGKVVKLIAGKPLVCCRVVEVEMIVQAAGDGASHESPPLVRISRDDPGRLVRVFRVDRMENRLGVRVPQAGRGRVLLPSPFEVLKL
jgi:hypothetical protein